MKSLKILLSRIVDYAGLFPPAGLPMEVAVRNFAEYHRGPKAWMLGRFVVPASRLQEFETAAAGLLPAAGEAPWELSVLGGEDPEATAEALKAFRLRHSGEGVVATAVEMKASSPETIQQGLEVLPESVEIFFEVAHDRDPAPLLSHLAGTRGRAKIRSGGVTEGSFPDPRELADFLLACKATDVPFKATAGLHHPLRGRYRLTYEEGSPEGTMFGFLNVFAAAAFLRSQELTEEELVELLTEEQAQAFSFTDTELSWHDRSLSLESLDDSRARFALSYGSCSFLEPIEDLQALDLL